MVENYLKFIMYSYLSLCQCYQGGVEMPIKDMISGYWTRHLQNAINPKPSYEGGTNGGKVVARVIQDIAIAKSYAPTKDQARVSFLSSSDSQLSTIQAILTFTQPLTPPFSARYSC
ncbi:hypothetical protein Syun_014873 [Stephania yunnanensis]|uniref:Uncharacterized protein n=1 Tax=Stephania yunnanensis TaxID=152371 RepID=A0AAP0JLV8_9MAGN